MRNAELYLKGATVITPCSRFQQDCPNYSDHRSKLLTDTSSDDTKLLRFTQLKWPEIVTKQTSISTPHVFFENFYKKKASPHKQRHLDWCFLSFLPLKCIFCLRNIMSFIEAFARLGICLFRNAFSSESSKTCHFRTVLTLLLLTMVSVNHIIIPEKYLVSTAFVRVTVDAKF